MARRSGSKGVVCVVVAGRQASGKTAVLNNLFGLELPTGRACRPGGKSLFDQTRVMMNEVSLLVMDTPSLEVERLGSERLETAGNVCDAIRAERYTLLYCLSAVGEPRLSDADRTIVRNLHAVLGAEAWNNSVVLFTFADSLRQERFNSRSKNKDYKEHLKALAGDFQRTLRECAPDLPALKTIFELEEGGVGSSDVADLVAIPVGKHVEWSEDLPILLDVISPKENWTDLVFAHFLQKTPPDKRVPFVVLKYGPAVANTALSQTSCLDAEEGGDDVSALASSVCWWNHAGSDLSVRNVIAAVRACRDRDKAW